jgi:hypothetical protein
LSIQQSGHTIGSTIGVGGAGFKPGDEVVLKYDDIEVSTITAESDSTFVTLFEAPPSAAGEHVITATDESGNSAEITFEVEDDAPKIPPPLKPESGANAKTPVSFDWADVTDESAPVTYDLQIASDRTFADSAILVQKTGLESSSYILSEAEELKLGAREESFYWRVRAADAASNESQWTGAGEFFVPVPFTFSGWILWAAIGVGTVLVFLIGLWVGRKTAFFY